MAWVMYYKSEYKETYKFIDNSMNIHSRKLNTFYNYNIYIIIYTYEQELKEISVTQKVREQIDCIEMSALHRHNDSSLVS